MMTQRIIRGLWTFPRRGSRARSPSSPAAGAGWARPRAALAAEGADVAFSFRESRAGRWR